MNFKDLYSQRILDHYNHSAYRGTLEKADINSGVYNPACGDRVSVQLNIKNNSITQAKFEAQGCVMSGAAASLLMEHIQGMVLDECMALTSDTMLDLVKIPLGPNRLRCILIVLEAVQTGIQTYKSATR